MIGKDDEGIDGEGARAPDPPHRFAQRIDPLRKQSIAAPLQKINREEIAAARDAKAMKIGNRSTPVREPKSPNPFIRRNTPLAIPTYRVAHIETKICMPTFGIKRLAVAAVRGLNGAANSAGADA